MPRVFIPSALRTLIADQKTIDVDGESVGEVIDNLDQQFPGVRDRLCQDDALRAGIAVVVGDTVSTLGLLQRTKEDAEIHFLPAIGGG